MPVSSGVGFGSVDTIKTLMGEGGRSLGGVFSDIKSAIGLSSADAVRYLIGAEVLGTDFNSIKNFLLTQFGWNDALSILRDLGFSVDNGGGGGGSIIGKIIDSIF